MGQQLNSVEKLKDILAYAKVAGIRVRNFLTNETE